MTDLRAEWSNVVRKLRSADALMILVDFDGALVEADQRGGLRFLPTSIRSRLQSLSTLERLALAIFWNGSMADLVAQVGMKGVWYLSSGGLDVLDPEGVETRFYVPDDMRVMAQLRDDLLSATAHIAGVLVEGGGPFVALHYRHVDPQQVSTALEAFRSAVAPLAQQVITTHSAWAIEARIRCTCDEKTAVRFIRRECKPGTLTLYFGRNPRIQEALLDLRPSSISVEVGDQALNRPEFRLPDAAAVLEILTRVAAEWSMQRPVQGGSHS